MSKSSAPPGWVNRLVEALAPDQFIEEIKGDLYELYEHDISKHANVRRARFRYAVNAGGFLLRQFFWKHKKSNVQHIMIGNYFRIAKRSLMFYKGNTIINILGLATGIAAVLFILLVVRHELSYDTFHSNAERIYRIIRVSGPDKMLTDQSECRTGVSYPVADALRDEIPAIEHIVPFDYTRELQIDIPEIGGKAAQRYVEHGAVMTNPDIFQVLDFHGKGFRFLAGNEANALKEPYSVVLTESLAKKYFPSGSVLGNTITLGKNLDFKVTGIVSDFPENTDFPFTVMMSYSTLHLLAPRMFTDWSSVDDSHQVLVKGAPGLSQAELEQQIAKVHAAHTDKDLHDFRHYLLQPLTEVHFDARFENYNRRTISKPTVLALGLIGIFLLFAASINYINLSTAQSTMRSREIGLRKVMGSNASNLVLQFIIETFVVVCIASLFGLLLAEILLPQLDDLLNLGAPGLLVADPAMWIALVSITAAVTLLAGAYPAFRMSKFDAVTAMKGKFGTQSLGGFNLRRILVVSQFTITQVLVVGTFIVVSQMRFFQNIDLGFSRDLVLVMPIHSVDKGTLQTLEDQLRAQSYVENVTFSSTTPSGRSRNTSYRDVQRLHPDDPKDWKIFEFEAVDEEYINFYGIAMAAGRQLSTGDSIGNILINKTLARRLGWDKPDKAVGEQLRFDGDKIYTVVGVVNDFYSNSLKEDVDNIAMFMRPRNYNNISVKLQAEDGQPLSDAVFEIQKIWLTAFPTAAFQYQFFDEDVKAYYESEEKYARLFQLFSSVFLLIGCLGLYGLITFVVNRKGKEVAIRKVLGATFSNVLTLFSREYVRLIALSFVLAVPIAYYAVNSWLSNFKNHITLDWWLFVLPGVGVLLIALAVVVSKSVRAAKVNPVDSLRME